MRARAATDDASAPDAHTLHSTNPPSDLPIGALIRAYRRHRNMTVAALAERAELSTRYIEMIEQGIRVPAVAKLARIAEALDVSPDVLIAQPRPEGTSGPFIEIQDALLGVCAEHSADRQDVAADLRAATFHWEQMRDHHWRCINILPSLLGSAAHLARHDDAQSRTLAVEIYKLAATAIAYLRPDLAAAAARLADIIGD